MKGGAFFSAGVLHRVKLTPTAYDQLGTEENLPRQDRDWQIGDIVVFDDETGRETHGRVIMVSHDFVTIGIQEE